MSPHCRIFVGLFSEQIGGQRAASEWVARVDEVLSYRRINRPLAIFGEGGVLTPYDIEALVRRLSNIEVS